MRRTISAVGVAAVLAFHAIGCGGSGSESSDSRQASPASRLWAKGVRWDPETALCGGARDERSIWQTAIDVVRDETNRNRQRIAARIGVRDMSNSTPLRTLEVTVVDERGAWSNALVDLKHVDDLRTEAVPFSDADWPSDFKPDRPARSGVHTVYFTTSGSVLVACSGFTV